MQSQMQLESILGDIMKNSCYNNISIININFVFCNKRFENSEIIRLNEDIKTDFVEKINTNRC